MVDGTIEMLWVMVMVAGGRWPVAGVRTICIFREYGFSMECISKSYTIGTSLSLSQILVIVILNEI